MNLPVKLFFGGQKSKSKQRRKNTGIYIILAVFLIILSASPTTAREQNWQEDYLSPPELIWPAAGERVSTPMPRLQGRAPGATRISVAIDKVLNGWAEAVNGEFSYYPFRPLGSGEHTVTLQSHNSQGKFSLLVAGHQQIYITPNPAPTWLVPKEGQVFGQDRVWVGGVAKNNSVIRILVNGVEFGRVKVKNHKSGTASFSVDLSGVLPIGKHVISAIARDRDGKDSYLSYTPEFEVRESTPAPVALRSVVNSDSGIEWPIIAGLAKSGLAVSIVIDGKIAASFTPKTDPSGTTSFAWQLNRPLALGQHKIEAFASDQGKLSNNSPAVYWQVGDFSAINEGAGGPAPKEPDGQASGLIPEKQEPGVVITKGDQGDEILSVKPKERQAETPVVPDISGQNSGQGEIIVKGQEAGGAFAPADAGLTDDEGGRVMADDDKLGGLARADEDKNDAGVRQLAPGAVTRATEDGQGANGINNSLIIGIVILVLLLGSIIIWYIQERKESLGDKVASIFREIEDEESAKSADDMNKNSVLPETPDQAEKESKGNDKNNLPPPPPPPPVF